jgi:phosphoesterase RecJ-like protein
LPTFDPPVQGLELHQALSRANRITALCHENPDADTIGGAIAMSLIAARLGKEAEVVSVDRPAAVFDFLPQIERVRRKPSFEPDLAIVCDAATLDRVGSLVRDHASWLSGATLVNIDHHVTNTNFGDVNCVDPTSAATCQVIAEMLPYLHVELGADIATSLLTGVVRDSHGFSAPATSPRTLRVAAELLEAGADLPSIHRRILAELPYRTIALWGRLLANSQLAADGRVVHTTLMPRMLDETGTAQEDADGLVEFMANTKEALVAVLFRELGQRETRVSLRVREPVDATFITAPFGGGGHRLRAGCTVDSPAELAVPRVLAVCERAVAELSLPRS